MNEFLQTPIAFLKGVGPQRAELLRQEINVVTVNDLLNYFPFRYVDRSAYHTVADLRYLDSYAQLRGTLVGINEVAVGRQKKLVAKFQDASGLIELVWFQGIHFIKPLLKLGAEYQVYGKAKMYGNTWNIPHPELTEWQNVGQKTGIQPVYSSTEKLAAKGLHTKGIEKLTSVLALQLKGKIPEILPDELLKAHNFMSREAAFKEVHLPTSEHAFHVARQRLKFEELFFLQMELLLRKQISVSKSKGFIFSEVGTLFTDFYEKYLPFSLTGAQKRVLKEIRKDFLSGHHMNRLLQGDVGSGKTLVALLTMLIANGNGFQAALMAPTEILANQHFLGLSELAKTANINIKLLTGSTKTAERKIIHEALEDGSLHILIGTHALLEDKVQFKNLGLAVIDEQHRFGVEQRSKLWKKNEIPPHVLVMTATPIPRTLAMSLYGDLDISVIDELPPGRKPIQTVHRFDSNRLKVWKFLKDEIALGRQIYIVYPLIQESEKMDFKDLMDGYESISRDFPLPQYSISILHGKMKPADKESEMKRFAEGKTNIMVATTVIEVGVNVPNASVMIIESAERFGLSQLHQLRGRVGRGAEQSYCILMTSHKLSSDSKTRMETMVSTNDGFEIAEVDLKLRGPGDLMGTQQSGVLNLQIADIVKDRDILLLARNYALQLLKNDAGMHKPEHATLRTVFIEMTKKKNIWNYIS